MIARQPWQSPICTRESVAIEVVGTDRPEFSTISILHDPIAYLYLSSHPFYFYSVYSALSITSNEIKTTDAKWPQASSNRLQSVDFPLAGHPHKFKTVSECIGNKFWNLLCFPFTYDDFIFIFILLTLSYQQTTNNESIIKTRK